MSLSAELAGLGGLLLGFWVRVPRQLGLHCRAMLPA